MVILVLSVSVFVCVWILVPSLLHFLHDFAVFSPKFLLSYFVQFVANGPLQVTLYISVMAACTFLFTFIK